MSSEETSAAQSLPYASEPIVSGTLTLDRRNGKLAHLRDLQERFKEAVGPLTIDHEVQAIRELIRAKALDEEFSVAIRERWQTWSRDANPFRTELASTAASELSKAAETSDSASDPPSDDSAVEEPEPTESVRTNTRKRKAGFRAKEIKVHVGSSELSMTEGWETIRREREERLGELDAALPSAFRFSDRQLKVYAHRLKPKYVNSLDRPFEASNLQGLLRISPSQDGAQCRNAPPEQVSAAVSASTDGGTERPSVYCISFYSSSLDPSHEDAQQRDTATPASDVDARDNYVKRICGDGLGGIKRLQTVELLSSQTLSDLQSSLVCWSDEQPERHGWRQRLQRYLRQRGHSPPEEAQRPLDEPAMQEDSASEEENHEACNLQFTGQRRHTDTALVIENKLYGNNVRSGDAPHEADYATLLSEWKSRCGLSDAEAGWSSSGGDLGVRLDELGSVRIGQPYWLLHQGDCVHAFVIEQMRALRPLEEAGRFCSDLENVPSGSAVAPFPRITWLSTPAMLRFAADSKANYGLGHRILHWEELLAGQSFRVDGKSGDAGVPAADEAAQRNAWQIVLGRTRRKDEGLLRQKQGKCLACSLRKAKVGILGGDRVRLPFASGNEPSDASVLDGLDDHLTTLCTSCAAILGLPTREAEPGASRADIELDWQRINTEKPRSAGWAVFPLYQ